MKIKKGTKLLIGHSRKGEFKAIAIKDFDTEKEEFYPVAVAQDQVCGMSDAWVEGEEIPCRRSLCKIIKVVEK